MYDGFGGALLFEKNTKHRVELQDQVKVSEEPDDIRLGGKLGVRAMHDRMPVKRITGIRWIYIIAVISMGKLQKRTEGWANQIEMML